MSSNPFPSQPTQPWGQQQQPQQAWGQVQPPPQQLSYSQQTPFPSSHQQPQQQPPPPPASQPWGTAGAGWDQFQPPTLNDPMLNAGLQAGVQMATAQANMAAQQFAPGVSSLWGSLKHKFTVNNVFVRRKLGVLLFPFGKKDWAVSTNPPAVDNNAPDLYIPVMALVTYVLAFGLVKGTSMKFDPEVLVDAFGSSVTALVLQVGLMRVFLWSLGPMAPPVPWLDLAAIAGYAFVGVALNLLVGVALGSFSYSLSLVWTCMALGYCMFRQMQQVVPAPEPGQRGRRHSASAGDCVSGLLARTAEHVGGGGGRRGPDRLLACHARACDGQGGGLCARRGRRRGGRARQGAAEKGQARSRWEKVRGCVMPDAHTHTHTRTGTRLQRLASKAAICSYVAKVMACPQNTRGTRAVSPRINPAGPDSAKT
jgi:hypothetical protein